MLDVRKGGHFMMRVLTPLVLICLVAGCGSDPTPLYGTWHGTLNMTYSVGVTSHRYPQLIERFTEEPMSLVIRPGYISVWISGIDYQATDVGLSSSGVSFSFTKQAQPWWKTEVSGSDVEFTCIATFARKTDLELTGSCVSTHADAHGTWKVTKDPRP
jgi:hypothetical protein